ncbi:hypothetical protein [Niallia circulans]|nr:hypothetical protein [Niallia circulans]
MKKYFIFNLNYIPILLVIHLCILLLAYFASYLSSINLLNNGYIDQRAITFITNENPSFIMKNQDNSILIQSQQDSNKVKNILLGEKVLLPPINWIENYSEITLGKENVAIIGENAQKENVPKDYEIIGTFSYLDSYKLNNDIWLISRDGQVNDKNGNIYIFNSQKEDSYKQIRKLLKERSIKIVDTESSGTYTLNSNKTLINALKIGLFF